MRATTSFHHHIIHYWWCIKSFPIQSTPFIRQTIWTNTIFNTFETIKMLPSNLFVSHTISDEMSKIIKSSRKQIKNKISTREKFWKHKLHKNFQTWQIYLILMNNIGEIVIGCWWCTQPNIHLPFHCAGTLKIMGGCLSCGVLYVLCDVVCCNVLCVNVLYVSSFYFLSFCLSSLFFPVLPFSSLLFDCRHQTHCKTLNNQHGVQLWSVGMCSGANFTTPAPFTASANELHRILSCVTISPPSLFLASLKKEICNFKKIPCMTILINSIKKICINLQSL